MTGTMQDARCWITRSFVGVLALAALAPACAAAQSAEGVITYEFVYPYNTPDLIENHVIVLDRSGGEPRGWYYGTSDEFDQAREGYLPGFFVAPMSDVVLSSDRIAFTLARPARFFASPVPLEYRTADAVPAGSLEAWSIQVPMAARRYEGSLRGDSITLEVPGGPRVFLRR